MKHTLAKYLLELSIMDYQIVHYHPSEVSAACLCLAVKLLDDDDCTWDETLQFYSTYSEEHLQPIMNRLALMAFKSSTDKQQVSFDKDLELSFSLSQTQREVSSKASVVGFQSMDSPIVNTSVGLSDCLDYIITIKIPNRYFIRSACHSILVW